MLFVVNLITSDTLCRISLTYLPIIRQRKVTKNISSDFEDSFCMNVIVCNIFFVCSDTGNAEKLYICRK